MGVQVLIHARDLAGTEYNKGDVCAIRSDAEVLEEPWGTGESLPDFVIARVTNIEKAAIEKFNRPLRNKFSYELLNQNAQGRRYRISMNPRAIAQAENAGLGVRSSIRALLVDKYNATVFSVEANNSSAVFDIPNTDWAQLRADAKALVEDIELPIRRYTFNSGAVDNAVAQGGVVDVTIAQLQANLVDQEI